MSKHPFKQSHEHSSTQLSFGILPKRAIDTRIWLQMVLLLGIFLVLRLPNLLVIPLFFDESVYLERALSFPARLDLTLADGKLLQELLLAVLVHLPSDPLFSGRILSVVCGIGTLFGLWLNGRALGQPGAGLLAGMFYAGAPLAGLHDRLAIPDSMLTCVGCFILLASIWFTNQAQPRRWHAAIVGGLIAAASLVKLPGLFLFSFVILAMLALGGSWTERKARLRLLPTMMIVALVVLAALAPFHYGGAEQSKIVAPQLGNWLIVRLRNLVAISDWLLRYLPGPLLVLPGVSLVLLRHSHSKHWPVIVWLLAAGIGLHAIFLIVGSQLAPRYLLPAWPPLLLACAISASELWRSRASFLRVLCGIVLGSALIWDGYVMVQLLRDPPAAPLAAIDRRQYFETWTAGYQVPEIISFLEQAAAEHGTIVIVAHDQPRLIHNAPLIYLHNHSGVVFEIVDLRSDTAIQQLDLLAEEHRTYLLLDEQEQLAFQVTERFSKLEVIQVFQNPLSEMRFYVYEIRSDPAS